MLQVIPILIFVIGWTTMCHSNPVDLPQTPTTNYTSLYIFPFGSSLCHANQTEREAGVIDEQYRWRDAFTVHPDREFMYEVMEELKYKLATGGKSKRLPNRFKNRNASSQNSSKLKLRNPFRSIYWCLGTKTQVLDMANDADKDEAQMVLQYVHNSYNASEAPVTVQGIYRIERLDEPELTLDNRMLLWHGTSVDNLLSILHGGLQIAPSGVVRSKCGDLFGKGLYFGDMFAKAKKYSHSYGTGAESKFILLCEVALGKVHGSATNQEPKSRKLKPDVANSIKSSDSRYHPDPDATVFFKGATVPLGKRIENSIPDNLWGLDYNEYVVFKQNQVKLRYLVQYSQ